MGNQFNTWSRPVVHWPAFCLAFLVSAFLAWNGWVLAGTSGYLWTSAVVTVVGVVAGIAVSRRDSRIGAGMVTGFLAAGSLELLVAGLAAALPWSS